MRKFLLILAGLPALALDLTNGNAMTIKDRTGSTQTNRPFTIHRIFAQGEIPGYPQPYVGGTGVTTWQTDNVNRWSDGTVQSADISFRATVSASSTITVDFRTHANPCSTQNSVALCRADGLSTSAALNFDAGAGAGNWNAKQKFTAKPQGPTTVQTISARTMLTDGNCYAWLSGPAATQYVCGKMKTDGSMDTARTYAFGFAPKRVLQLAAGTNSTQTSVAVQDATAWGSITTPFKVYTNSLNVERMYVCYVDVAGKTIYFGNSAGVSSACANVNGRGIDGTTAADHSVNYGDKIWWDEEGIRLTADLLSNSTTITVNDATTISSPSVIQIRDEKDRICNKSGNVLTPGTAGNGCSYSFFGRYYGGTNADAGSGSIGWNSGTPVYTVINNWIDAPAARYKSLEPVFVLTFYTGWSGVGIEYIYLNQSYDRAQDQEFDWQALKSPSDTVVVSKTWLHSVPGTSDKYPDGTTDALWKNDRKIWDGTAPGEVLYDFNLPYMRLTGIIPHDTNITGTASLVNDQLTVDQAISASGSCASPALEHSSHGAMAGYDSTTADGSGSQTICQAFNFDGSVYRGLPDPGGRFDIGVIPGWYASALFMMANSSLASYERWYEVMLSTAAIGGHIPVVFTEADTSSSLKYCASLNTSLAPGENTVPCTGGNEAIPAFGYPLSKSARPNLNWINPAANDYSELRNKVGIFTRGGWGISQSDVSGHWPGLPFLPYILTGDWHYYWTQLGYASYTWMNANFPPNCSTAETSAFARQHCGNGSWGTGAVYPNGNRLLAWNTREMGQMAFIGRPDSPEKQMFTRATNINLAVVEGKFNITDGSFYNTCGGSPTVFTSWWCFGRRYRGNNDPFFNITAISEWSLSPGDQAGTTDYMINYHLSVLGHLRNLGFSADGAFRGQARRILQQVMNRAEWPMPFSISCYAQYASPIVVGNPNTIGTQVTYTNWAAAYADRFSACSSVTSLHANDCDLTGGYARIAQAVMAMAEDMKDPTGGWTGKAAWDWVKNNSSCNTVLGNNVHWAFSPPSFHKVRNIRVHQGTTTATVRFERPENASACTYVLGTSLPANSSTAGDTSVSATPWNRELSLSLTGLTTATTYYLRLTCGQARGQTSFTTN